MNYVAGKGFKLNFRADKFVVGVQQKVEQRWHMVGLYLVREIVRTFGSPSAYPGKKAADGVTAKQWRMGQHSNPGDPPFVQTGTLRRSIAYRVESANRRIKLLVGSSLKPQGGSEHSYAWWLERGSGKMLARPYLRPAVLNNKGRILETLRNG